MKMHRKLLILILYLLACLLKIRGDIASESRKFVHQRDISDHCKRRVVPSVFLGQHVTSANSQVMQFSQLEVPYSCSLSVRAEAGSNIILVVQLLSEDNLIDACSVSGDQLVVYEFGETFGGYWGPIPNVIMKESVKNYTKYYTLKTTKPPTKSHRTPKKQTTSEKILKQTETPSPTVKEQEYYTIDVPIVNVSGNFQLGPPRETLDSEDLFNYIYDVTPRNGVEYETSMLPLVQFSIRQQASGYGAANRLYELDYDSKGFTIDPRLIFNTAKKRQKLFKKDWKNNQRFRHGTKSTAMFKRRDPKSRWKFKEAVTPLIPTLDSNYFTNSWESADDFIKSLNTTTVRSTIFQNETFKNILNIISNSQHNSSVYLARNISAYNGDVSEKENETIYKDLTDSNPAVGSSTKDVEKKTSALDMFSLLSYSTQKSNQETLNLNKSKTKYLSKFKNYKAEGSQKDKINMSTDELDNSLKEITTLPSTSKYIKTSLLKGTMVDHESWENIVQAAPVMAGVLNSSEPIINNTINNILNKRKHKRHIQSLEIEKSRPRNLTTKAALVSDTSAFDDIHDMARLLELEDDELGSRVALRYLRHYAGRAVYNLCDHTDTSLRQMFLFNSSRIVIAVSNFTLDRMLLVLTPAQTILGGVSQCPDGQLECQIVGTRVCIDSLNACDGVPNCGSYDIYDEERLTCGFAPGLQRGVSLAALTFLAVLLTGACTALYWLERCVPRVSDAFFVYSDSTENELLLDSIMRSPYDDEDPSYKMNYAGHFFEDDALYQEVNAEEKKVNFCRKIIKICWRFFSCSKSPTERWSEKDIPENQLTTKEPSRMYSFTQLELKKFAKVELKEEAVQTGDMYNNKEKNSVICLKKFKTIENLHDASKQESEINLLKFSKESRLSYQSDDMFYENPDNMMKRHSIVTDTAGEKEIKSTLYENISTPRKTPVTYDVHTETKRMGETSKRLRFDEELQMISAINEEDGNLPQSSSVIQRLNNDDLNKIVQETGSVRDFMRFWGSKGKKSKKKKLKQFAG